jgi:peptidoglycan biosynthesis protein MviN/MurJ (putative lipid II flippase)
VGVVSIVIYSTTAVLLLQSLGLLSLMVADAIKHFIHTAIMLWLLQRHLGGLAGHRISSTLVKSLLAAVMTGLAAYGAAEFLGLFFPLSGFLHKFLIVAGSSSFGLLIYVGMVLLFDIPEAKSLYRLLRDKLKQSSNQ